jgi:hypothetical protein
MGHHGACHCGRIGFDVDGDIDRVIECNCSICSKRGTLLWMVPRERLRLATRYRFCPSCGVATFSEGADKTGAAIAAVNVRCLDGIEPANLTLTKFDGRSL